MFIHFSPTHECKQMRNYVQNRTKGDFWVAKISFPKCVWHFEVYNQQLSHTCIENETHNSFIKPAALVFKRTNTRLRAFTLTDIYRQKEIESRVVWVGLYNTWRYERRTLIQAIYRHNSNFICKGNNIPLETKNIPYKVFIFFIHLIRIFGLILF